MINLKNRIASMKIALGRLVCVAAVVAILLTLPAGLSAQQYTEVDSFLNPASVITLGSPGYSTDLEIDTAVFQRAIDDVAAAGGGHVVVPRGVYEIGPVRLRSEVHLLFVGHSTIRGNATGFPASRNINLIDLGDSGGPIENASVRGINSASRFELDRFHHDRLRVFRVGNATNFLISNFDVADTRTTFSGISLGWTGLSADGSAPMPNNGTVQHFRSSNAHYGFGAIQAQGSRGVLFKDIEAVGGVALRIETGFPVLNRALARGDRMENSIDNVSAEDISSFHGQSALFLSPHAMHQGSVTAQNIRSVGSEYALLIDGGSLHRFTPEEISTLGLTEGTWESISVDGIDSTFGAGPIETRWVHLEHYPDEFRRGQPGESVYLLPATPAVYDHRQRGPSIAPVVNDLFGAANVAVSNITSQGFLPSHAGQIDITDTIDFNPSERNQVAIGQNNSTGQTPLAGRLLGDINDDEVWTAADLDLLFDAFGSVTQGGPFDLVNNDGVANLDDVGYWLRSIMGSEFGDANLDGRVSFLDIEIYASNLGQAGSWADGDFNNDGIVNADDLDILEQNYAAHPADEQLTFQEALEAAGLSTPVILGDCNLDGVVNFLDIAPLIQLLSSGVYLEQADCNIDGAVNFLDIAPFIQILSN